MILRDVAEPYLHIFVYICMMTYIKWHKRGIASALLEPALPRICIFKIQPAPRSQDDLPEMLNALLLNPGNNGSPNASFWQAGQFCCDFDERYSRSVWRSTDAVPRPYFWRFLMLCWSWFAFSSWGSEGLAANGSNLHRLFMRPGGIAIQCLLGPSKRYS